MPAAVVVGRTEKEARDKVEDYRRHSSVEGALAHFSTIPIVFITAQGDASLGPRLLASGATYDRAALAASDASLAALLA